MLGRTCRFSSEPHFEDHLLLIFDMLYVIPNDKPVSTSVC